MSLRLRAWRAIWTACVHHGAPRPILLWVEGHFLDAGMAEALRRSAAEYRAACEVEAQRRSWAYGQVAMHDPTITREQVEAIADTLPAPGEEWACLAGDGPACDPGDGMHDDVPWPSSQGARGWEA